VKLASGDYIVGGIRPTVARRDQENKSSTCFSGGILTLLH